MIRATVRFEVLYGHWMDALEICTEIDKQCQAKGLQPTKILAPLAGKGNTMVCESDYESLADYEREGEVYNSDPEIMKNTRRLGGVTVQGSTWVELLEEAPTLA